MIEHKLATEYTIFDSDIMLCNGKYVQAQTIEIWELFVDRKEDYVSFRIGLPIIVLSLFSYLAYKKVENKKDYNIFILCNYIFNHVFKYFYVDIITGFFVYIAISMENANFLWLFHVYRMCNKCIYGN